MRYLEYFWDILWTSLTIFIFIAWLMVLFTVIIDLFRDRKMSGVAKAIWLVCLIFIPVVTVLIYLIVRGGSMGERAAAQQQEHKAATDDYIRSVTGATPTQQIEQAKRLLDSGAISPAEFETLKAKALS